MSKHSQNTFSPNEGVTPAERYLQRICNKTFLSLWSYPGLFKKPGDELCDLLVIFENDIIIFSDKNCKFPKTNNLQIDWERWFDRTVYKSARQAWGAERWIKNFPDRIFTDKKATNKFPFIIPNISAARFHLIVVAHDGARRCAEEFGGSGSLMINTYLVGPSKHTEPFYIGDLDRERSFIHVLDDTTLDILLNKLDTITDFTAYLEKKEHLLRSNVKVVVTGEEELLANYLSKINKDGVHDFVFPSKYNGIFLVEGYWEDFIKSEQYKKQVEADRISYTWDRLIQKFNHYALTGSQYLVTGYGLQTSEKILRFMAMETRVHRRMLSKIIMDMIEKTPSDKQYCRIIGPSKPNTKETTYVFLLFPRKDNIDDQTYRERRGLLLEAYCYVAKIRIPYSKTIVGIATESGINNETRSEDAVYLDASHWNEELQSTAEGVFNDMKLKKDVVRNFYHEDEYPELINLDPKALTVNLPKNPRNKLCPCGSGKKYKYCHGS